MSFARPASSGSHKEYFNSIWILREALVVESLMRPKAALLEIEVVGYPREKISPPNVGR